MKKLQILALTALLSALSTINYTNANEYGTVYNSGGTTQQQINYFLYGNKENLENAQHLSSRTYNYGGKSTTSVSAFINDKQVILTETNIPLKNVKTIRALTERLSPIEKDLNNVQFSDKEMLKIFTHKSISPCITYQKSETTGELVIDLNKTCVDNVEKNGPQENVIPIFYQRN